MKKIISNVENVSKGVLPNGNINYVFNDKEIEIDGVEILEKVNKIINGIVNRFCVQYENSIVLTGAGTSILKTEDLDKVGISEDLLSHFSGKTMWTLRDEIQSGLELLGYYDLNKIAELSKYEYRLPDDANYFNLEDLLSKIDIAKDFLGEDVLVEFNQTIKEIEKSIRKNCTLKLCAAHPHKQFMDKLTSRKDSYNRVKIYTTNYDTLFEEAAEEAGYIVIDGFSYSKQRKFSSKYFDYDFVEKNGNKIPDEPKYVPNIFQLLKIHGSIDWKLEQDGHVYKIENGSEDENPLMIYPRRAKFEQSYEKPYFELFSRFQYDLKQPNTLLIVIGFSFADKHILSIVQDATIYNPGLKILIVDVNIEKPEYGFFIDRASKFDNVMLFSSTFKAFVEEVYKKQTAYSDELFESRDRE